MTRAAAAKAKAQKPKALPEPTLLKSYQPEFSSMFRFKRFPSGKVLLTTDSGAWVHDSSNT